MLLGPSPLRVEDIEEFIAQSAHAVKKLEPLAKKYGIKITII